MLNFSSESTRSSNTFNQFSTTFRRIFNPFLINGRKSKAKDLEKIPTQSKSKLIEECKNSKVYPKADHPIEFINLNNNQIKECPICLLPLPINTKELDCGHSSCDKCLIKYLKTEISESRISITCPECTELLHPNRIQELLSNDQHYLTKYEEFTIRKVLVTDPDSRYCPAPNCTYVVIANNCSKCPILKCGRSECKTLFCYNCQQQCTIEHKCKKQQFKVESSKKLNKKSKSSKSPDKIDVSTESHSMIDTNLNNDENMLNTTKFLDRFNMKQCPSCRILIIKIEDGSCNHMTCSVCSTQFCWLCIKKASELHYLSPTGCTFFGKRQWSKKKKLFWQFGMLLGAPVFILLSAAIAVPSIIIGLPVYFGRKLQNKLSTKKLGKFKKCVFVTSGVVSSIVIAPILAAGAIAIGVPFLLAYVYGVVPITLCRTKTQVDNSSEQPMKINLNEEEAQAFLKQLSDKDVQIKEKNKKKSKRDNLKDNESKSKEKYKVLNINKSTNLNNSIASIESINNQFSSEDNSNKKVQNGSINELNCEINYLQATSSNGSNSRNSSSKIDCKSRLSSSSKESSSSLNVDEKKNGIKSQDLFEPKLIEVHCDKEGKKFMNKKPNKKLEVKSLENLANFCDVCDTVHRPCCPNFVC